MSILDIIGLGIYDLIKFALWSLVTPKTSGKPTVPPRPDYTGPKP
jgi:hypothetical protein